MKKYYAEPEITVRNYSLNPAESVMTTSGDPNLNDGDDVTYPFTGDNTKYFG